jgi:pimeloyl-ACP methyl ester carboxylesterase
MNKVTSTDGTTIAFTRTGDGPPIIMIDGAFSHRAINPTAPRIAALLAPSFSVYTYDRRGRGESGDTQPYAVEREIEDLGALIAEAGGSASVFGGSSGAMLALDAAAYGLPISKVALYELPARVDDSAQPLPDDYLPRLRKLLAANRRSDAASLWFSDVLGLPDAAIAGMRQGPFWVELEKVAPTLAYEGALFGDALSGKPLSPKRWGSITTPTLVIDGGASPAMMHSAADAVAGLLHRATRRTLDSQTHDVDAEVLAPVLAEFFQEEGSKAV